MDTDRDQRFANQRRLRELKRDHGDEVTIFCSHDAIELGQMQKLANPREREPIVPARGLQPATA
jgi:hypothetical protein